MITELFINSTSIDLNDDTTFALNYWLADIRSPENRKTNFSKTIIIPGTSKNNQLFSHIYQIGANSTFDPNVKADALLITGGAQTFDGYMQLKSINRQYDGHIEYEIALFGDLGNIFSDMGQSYVSDLDFSDLDHDRSIGNVIASWSHTTGYVYPLINNGQVDVISTSLPKFDVQLMPPCIFVKTIWDKIFDDYGYRYTSTFISGQPFTKLIFPLLGENRRRRFTLTGAVSYTVDAPSSLIVSTVTMTVKKYATNGTTTTLWTSGVTSINDFSGTFNIGQSEYEADAGDTIWVQFNFTSSDAATTCTIAGNSTFVGIYLDVDGGLTDGSFNVKTNGSQGVPQSTDYTVNFDTENYDPNNSWSTATDKHTVPIVGITQVIPVLKQRDFVLGLIRMFNLYVEPVVNDEKNLLILPRDQYYASGSTVNWTGKEDLSKTYVQEPMPLLNFKEFNWKYKEDSDFYNQLYSRTWGVNYGDKYYDAQTDFQTDSSNIELPFAATPSVQSALSDLVLPTIVKQNPILSPTGNVFNSKPRILYYGGMKTGNFDLKDGTTSYQQSSYPYCGHVDDTTNPTVDILFDTPKQIYWVMDQLMYTNNNLFNAYYSKMIQEVTDADSKLLTMYVYLTNHDVQKISFKNVYHILGHDFRLNRVYDYDPVRPNTTKIELFKIVNSDAFTAGVVSATDSPHTSPPPHQVMVIKPREDAVY